VSLGNHSDALGNPPVKKTTQGTHIRTERPTKKNRSHIRTTADNARLQRKRKTKEHLEKNLENDMWMADFKYSWRKMEATA